MMKRVRWLNALIGTCIGSAAFAHDGHSLSGVHWHATDSWGWVAIAVVAAVLWAARRK